MNTTMNQTCSTTNIRQRWMSIMARSDYENLSKHWQHLQISPEYKALRPAEIGMIMLKGRVNGDGTPFNMGEATVTRCSVQFTTGEVGTAYILGRHKQHAELAAVIDAQLQKGERYEEIWSQVIVPIKDVENLRQASQQSKAMKTKVDFFTLLRGED